MIAKLIVWAETREGALEKLHNKLSEYNVIVLILYIGLYIYILVILNVNCTYTLVLRSDHMLLWLADDVQIFESAANHLNCFIHA